MARITIEGAIASPTRKRVLKALREVEQREFPALLLRIDSPGGTVGDSQEIHAALLRLRDKGCHVVASFSVYVKTNLDAWCKPQKKATKCGAMLQVLLVG